MTMPEAAQQAAAAAQSPLMLLELHHLQVLLLQLQLPELLGALQHTCEMPRQVRNTPPSNNPSRDFVWMVV